ncbi:MAG: ParB N-terminal domain-containing protein [Candidatus Dormibacteraeota bacterium]|nr:ParB N-terminal domain-containing protein [Candidatus Dormibacteraeota bacterium]
MTEQNRLPAGLAVVPVDLILPCPIQPRVNISVDFVDKLSGSIKAGRHQPLLEVEPGPGQRGTYQIVCGEQRWRAAKAAGLLEILVRIHPHLGYLERLEKQYEENRLRADLDLVEEAYCILLDKTIRDIAFAEQLLRDSLVSFEALDEKRILHRDEFVEHLDGLRKLLVKHKTHTVKGSDGNPVAGPLSPWRESEQALGISESQRKAKVGVLRLGPELLDELRELPAEHTIQISRLRDADHQAELVQRARELTHRQVHRVVDSLLRDPDLDVAKLVETELRGERAASADPLTFDEQLQVLADLCRQLARALRNLTREITSEERDLVSGLLAGLDRDLADFRPPGVIDIK